jgi:cytochrome c-type biogenesis protein CcmH
MVMIRAIGLLVAFSLVASAVPQSTEETARDIEAMLIAPCCWSQPVSQHYSEAADQIRKEVRRLLAAGKSKQEILDYYVSAYGERILASPRPHGFNMLAYILPWAFLVMGVAVLLILLRKWTKRPPIMPESDAALAPPSEQYASRVEHELHELQ